MDHPTLTGPPAVPPWVVCWTTHDFYLFYTLSKTVGLESDGDTDTHDNVVVFFYFLYEYWVADIFEKKMWVL